MSAGPSLPVENSTENRSSRDCFGCRVASALVLYNVMNAALSTLPLLLCVYLREEFRINTPAVLGVNATTATLGDNTTTVATFTEEESLFDPLLNEFWPYVSMNMGVVFGVVLSFYAARLPSRFHRPERDPVLLCAELEKFKLVGLLLALLPTVFVPFLVGWEGHQDISSDYFVAAYPANGFVYVLSHSLTMCAVCKIKNYEGMNARIFIATIVASVVNMAGGSLMGLYFWGIAQRLALENSAPANASTSEPGMVSKNPDFAAFAVPLVVSVIGLFPVLCFSHTASMASSKEEDAGSLMMLLAFMGRGALMGVFEGFFIPSVAALSASSFDWDKYSVVYGESIPLGIVLGLVIGLMTYAICYGVSCQQASAVVRASTEGEGPLTTVLVEEAEDDRQDDEQREGYVPPKPKPKAVDPDSNLFVTASAQGAGAPLTGIELARMGPAQSQ